MRMVTIGDEVHRIVARRGTRAGATRSGWTVPLRGRGAGRAHARHPRAGGGDRRGHGSGAAGRADAGNDRSGQRAGGRHVQPGQGLVVMEAMKMENELRATAAGTVKAVPSQPGTAVEKGALLLELE